VLSFHILELTIYLYYRRMSNSCIRRMRGKQKRWVMRQEYEQREQQIALESSSSSATLDR